MMFDHHHHPDFPPPRHRALHVAGHICIGVLFGGALLVFLGTVVMYLWNAIMPALFAVGHLTFWHGLGLLLLARILVGGFHRGGGFGRPRGFGGRRPFGRHAARHQYEDWWREVGEQSYRDYSSARTPDATEQR